MKTLTQWFDLYGVSHQNSRNRVIHKICVPLIFFSVVGFLLLIPLQVAGIPVGEIIIAVIMMWYLSLGWKAFLTMLVQVVIAYELFLLIARFTQPLPVLITIFVLAWIGQFIGHNIEGKKPSFFEDLQFLLIGPLWIWRGIIFK